MSSDIGTGPGAAGESTARSVLRQALAALVAPDGGQAEPQDLADVLWISRLAGLGPLPDGDPEQPADRPAPPTAVTPSPGTPQRTDPGPDPGPDRPTEPEPPAPTTPRPDPKVRLHPRGAPTGPGRPEAVAPAAEVVQVTRPTALPGALAIARALRPLRRPLTQRPGGRRPLHLDEEATAAATAEAGVLLPVWQRARPRYSVDLLVDTGATMAVWHDLAGELATLLERHGAFEEVRTWSLDTDRDTPHLTPFRRRRTAVPQSAVPQSAVSQSAGRDRNWARPLVDPHRRRILFVLTDGVGPAWYGAELVPFLARTAATGPAAALQVLPRRLWHRTALRPAPVEARAATHGRPVPVLRTDTTLPGIPRGRAGEAARAAVGWLPLLEIDADWLAPWADLTAGRTTGWTPMLAAPLSGVPRPRRPRAGDTAPRPAADRVAAFRAGSSPNAYRLACHLAAAPLSLPVMRLVQRATVPESGQRELAELFLSGLIEVREKAAEPDEVVYDFVDDVREELLGELTRTESVRVLDHVLAKVSGRVAATFGGTLDFRALAASAGEGRHRLPERSRPFAEVAATVLAGAGGQHAAIARNLGSAMAGRAIRALLTPPPPIVSPPDPPRMIGRDHELRLLAEACEPGGTRTRMVVIEAAPGMGRRRLVQEYAQRHGGRHAFVHWIDGRTARTVGNGFERLRAALAADRTEPLGGTVRDHPNWLVVVDDLGSGALFPRELAQLIDSDAGRLIVTTDTRQGKPFLRSATTITLGFLTEAELREEIRHRLGDAYQRIEHAQEFQHLLDRMPRRPDELATWHLDEQLAALVGRAGAGDSSSNVRSFRLPSPALAMAAVSHPPGCLAVCGADRLIRYIDMTTGQEARPPLALEEQISDVFALAEASNSPFVLVTTGVVGGLLYWDTGNGSFVTGHRALAEPLVALAPIDHADGQRYLWTVDLNGRMRLWSPQDASVVAELPSLAGDHRSWAMTTLPQPDGPSLLIGVDPTGRLHRWRPDDPSTVESFPAAVIDPGRARSIVGITGDENRCVIASIGDRDTHVHIWEFEGHWRADQRREAEQPLLASRFRLIERIAQGRQSEIWRARDERDGTTVAVKTFDRERLPAAVGADPFLEQTGRLADLDHPGIVACRSAGIDPERLFLVMEFIDGPDLSTMLDGEPLPPYEAAAIAHGVAEALDYLHGRGITHGRIEPANILIRPDGRPVLGDFGIDLAGAGPADRADDLHALGNLLQQTGVPEALQGLVLELLHPDPRRRPSAAEAARRIDASGALRRPDRTPEPPLRFTLLGEVRVWRGDEPIDLGPQERGAVLAALLRYRGRPVRAEVLLDAVRPQHTSSAQEIDEVWVHVQELERLLNSPSAPRAVLEELADGHTWVLNAAAEQIDVVLFERALERAEAALADGAPGSARRHAEEALDLWRGTPLPGLSGPSVEPERTRLNELHRRAMELILEVAPPTARRDGRLSYSLLGPLRVLRGEQPVRVGSPHQEAVLAALLLHAPAAVPIASLINAVWGDRPPPDASAVVRSHVSRLRNALGDRTGSRGAADLLQSVSDGYRLTVDRGSLDAAVFTERLAAAAEAEQAGDLAAGHELLRSALDLWQGSALDGVPGPYASWERTRLTERRLAATEDLYATGLALGRHEEFVAEIELLVAAHPLRERLGALLMLALYRCGRKAEALEAFGRLRARLGQEFAVEPGPVVTRLHRMIQEDDRELHRPGRAEALVVPQGGTTAPAGVDAGRLPRGDAPQGVAIGLGVAEQAPVFVDFETDPLFAVFGDAGSGKTALLRFLVKQLTERYTPDQVGFLVFDRRHALLDALPPDYLVLHASSGPELETLARTLRVAANSRTPGNRRHKDVFLIVDDHELIAADLAADEEDPLSSLVEFLPQARELGLRVILARRCEGAGSARASQPFLRTVCDLGPHGVVLPGQEHEGPLLGAVAPQPLRPGEGIQVTPENPSGTLIQVGWMPTGTG